MTDNTISPEAWLDFVQAEYLDGFVKVGGTSIKFAVPLDDSVRSCIEDGITERARSGGYITACVSSADTRVHMVDQLFFRIADQVPWRQLCENVIVKLAREKGFVQPPSGEQEALVHRISSANSTDPDMLSLEARNWIGSAVLRNQSLTRDFRVAVTHLCSAVLIGGPDGESKVEAITDWLSGRNRSVSAVRPYQIFNRITRTNARHLLESLLLWVRFAGFPGVVITWDTSRVTIARNPRDELLFYTKPAMLDAYEVLRQFIDATDRMKGCLIVVIPAAEFLDIDPSSRGLGAYDALKLRVYDEIHDRRLVNPMGALVRVSNQRIAE